MVSDTILLRKKFSKASRNYDELSLIQREIADELFTRIGLLNSIHSVLDIGIGTGYLIEKFKLNYPNLRVYGIDLALGMLNRTKHKIPKVLLAQADAKDLPFKDDIFDMAISNLAYQWVGDLNYALQQAKRVLKDKGKFYFTVFTENTLKELREVIFELLDNDIKTRQLHSVAHLPSKSFIERLSKEIGFQDINIDLKIKKQYYPNLLELLNWLKLIGANRYWSDRFYEGLSSRCFIDSITKKYEKRFRDNDKIFATFEVLFVETQMGTR
ncbi:MAG: methyltransferase domain-containing protein [Candidatus Omnitrophica bacterium]|nr:methyltransferase domain-containing protein [Candidatus Omnitrophota bacterium]